MKFGTVACLTLISVFSNLYLFKPNHDVAWLLTIAERWLSGGSYIENFMEINPPMAIIAYLPAVFLKQAFGFSLIYSGVIYVTAVALFSVILINRVVSRLDFLSDRDKWLFVLFCLVAGMFVPGFQFGQREHLAFLLMVPYILYSGLVLPGETNKYRLFYLFLVGLASLGSTFKPMLLPLVPLLILVHVIRSKDIRRLFAADIVVFLLILFGYISLLYMESFGYQAVMGYVSKLYGAYEESAVKVFSRGGMLLLLVAWMHLLAWRYLRREKEYDFLKFTAFSQVVFFFSFFIQQKGWYYHALPIICLMVIEISWIAIVITRGPFADRLFGKLQMNYGGLLRLAIIPGLAIILLVVNSVIGHKHLLYKYMAREDVKFISGLRDGTSVYWFTTDLGTAFPAVTMSNLKWASRYPHQWLLAGLQGVKNSERQNAEWVQNVKSKLYSDIVGDFVAYKPEYVFVDSRDNMLGLDTPVDFIEWFSRDPEFKEIWSHYRYVSSIGHLKIYVSEDSFNIGADELLK